MAEEAGRAAPRVDALLAAFDRARHATSIAIARAELLAALDGSGADAWLACARALILRADAASAGAVLQAALDAYPDATALRYALAGVRKQEGRAAAAEALLREVLARDPGDAAATFLLAAILRDAGRMAAVARALRALFEHAAQDVGTAIRAVELLQDCQRQRDAAAICAIAFARGEADPRLHAYAGMLDIQLGEFAAARTHYAYALAHDPRAAEWNIPLGLAALQRYTADTHPDFAFFRRTLEDPELSPRARGETLFALAKACDDVGRYAEAASHLRAANATARARAAWSRKAWRRMIEGRLASGAPPFALPAADDWVPVFIVGVPRSGTTLVASLLARNPAVCNRGELRWLPELAPHLRGLRRGGTDAARHAAALYTAQCRQDDSSARWFIDKQPLNLLHVDLITALWPQARIVYCVRGARDTALSLWMQSFLDDAQAYAYDLGDIAAVIRGCARLGAHWRERHGAAIHVLRYEELAAQPAAVMAALAAWLGLPAGAATPDASTAAASTPAAIGTASLWQARQPVYTRSIGRWRRYAELIPELMRLPEA